MADPTVPQVISAEEIERMAQAMATQHGRNELQKELNEYLKTSNTLTGDSSNLLKKFGNIVSGVGNEAKEMGTKIAESISNLTGFKSLTDLINAARLEIKDLGPDGEFALGSLSKGLMVSSDLFGTLGRSAGGASTNINNAIGNIPVNKLIDVISSFSSISGDGAKTILGFVSNLATASDEAQNMQLGLLGIAASSGNLNETLHKTGHNFGEIYDYATNYTRAIFEAAQKNGMLSSTAQAYAAELAKIPGFMDKTIETSEGMGGSISNLSAVLKVATAYQISQRDITDQLAYSYKNFHTTGEKALQFVANMAKTAQNIHMPLDMMKSSVMSIADNLHFMGDNTQTAIRFIDRLAISLKEVKGIGPSQIADMAKDIMGGVANMDLGTEAWISQQSGGRGGVIGGLDMEIAKSEGKTDEVANRAFDAITKTFGRATTLNDVKNNQNNAIPFLQQSEMLKQFGLAKTTQEANIELKAVQEGGLGGLNKAIADLKATNDKNDPEKALLDAIKQGTEIEARYQNELVKAANQSILLQTTIATSSLETSRKLIGTGGINNRSTKLTAELSGSDIAMKTSLADQQEQINDIAKSAIGSIIGNKNKLEEMNKSANEPTPPSNTKPDLFGALGFTKTPNAASMMQIVDNEKMTPTKTANQTQPLATNQTNTDVDHNIKIEIDIKDGLETIIRKVVHTTMKDSTGSMNGIKQRT